MFDLDDTLVRTDDMKDVREACKSSVEPARLQAVRDQLAARSSRHIYTLDLLGRIRSAYPKLKLGVFTRSPRSYADTVLTWAYPGFTWDVVVGYENVKLTKPHGDGIALAMDKLGIEDLDRVMMVGDNCVDIRAAYNCGCLVTLDRSAWPFSWPWELWGALERVPDAIIKDPEKLLDVLAEPDRYLPELERLLAGASTSGGGSRFDKINHFVPKEVGSEKRAYPVFVCGRSFANYPANAERRKRHALTKSIEAHKDAEEFPAVWIDSIRRFIAKEGGSMLFAPKKVLVTVIPHRPGRNARLESLLARLEESIAAAPIPKRDVSVAPDLLAYKAGVKSQHLERLKQQDRFTNVRDHLQVSKPELVKPGTCIIVIDDVCTTGASLIYATKYLELAGAQDVKCLALAKNVHDVLA